MRSSKARTIQGCMLMSCLVLFQGCGSSGGSSDKQEAAVQKSNVLAPLITYPANGATVSGVTDVRVDLDPSAAYKSVALLIDGQEVAIDDKAPFELTWNPYFQSSANEASLVVKATTTDGELLRSDISLVSLNHNAYAPAISLVEPAGQQLYPYGTESLTVQWSTVQGATAYEYRINVGDANASNSTEASLSINEGANALYVRASQGEQWGRWVQVHNFIVNPPLNPSISASSADTENIIAFEAVLDPNASYSNVSLIVNGDPIQERTEPPYSFSWDPYYFLNGSFDVGWYIEATLNDGRTFRSPAEYISSTDSIISERLDISLPSGGPAYYGIDQLAVSWNPVAHAANYQYEFSGEVITTDETSASFESLSPADYQVRVRAIDADGNIGAWSQRQAFTIARPDAPSFTNEQSELSNVTSVEVAWSEIVGASSYEYRVEGQWVSADQLSTEVPTPAPGYYSVDVRGVDALGRPGSESTFSFRILAPNAPNIMLSESITDEELMLDVNWGELDQNVTIEISKDYQANDVLVSYTSDNNTNYSFALPAGKYYVRAKTSNSAGHESDWYSAGQFSLGLFFIEADIASFGFDTDDRPRDFIIDPSAITLLSANGNVSDATSDDFNISRISRDGNIESSESFGSIGRSPRTLSKTPNGTLATGSGTNYYNSVIIGTNDVGSYLWHKTVRSEFPDENTRIEDRVNSAAELSDGRLVYASTYYIWDIDGNYSEVRSQEQRVTILDENRENPIVATLPAPDEGELQYMNQLLVDEDEIFVAGRYKYDNSGDASDDTFVPVTTKNGAFLAKVTSTGEVTELKTGSGLSNTSLNNISKMRNDIVVSYSNYDRCAATYFQGESEPEAIYLGDVNYCHAVLLSNRDLVFVGKDNDSAVFGEPLVITRFTDGLETERMNITRLSANFTLSKVKYNATFGIVIVGTYKFGSSYDDTRTVIFNISDDFEHVAN